LLLLSREEKDGSHERGEHATERERQREEATKGGSCTERKKKDFEFWGKLNTRGRSWHLLIVLH